MERYGPAVAQKVALAWYAVGLGTAESPSPSDGATNVEPWSATLEWSSFAPADWTVRVATDDQFTNDVETYSVDATSTSTASLELTLRPGTKYFWQVAPYAALSSTNALWESCALGTWSFTTKKKETSLLEPKSPTNKVYVTDFLGGVRWKEVEGATGYTVKVSATSNTNACDDDDAT